MQTLEKHLVVPGDEALREPGIDWEAWGIQPLMTPALEVELPDNMGVEHPCPHRLHDIYFKDRNGKDDAAQAELVAFTGMALASLFSIPSERFESNNPPVLMVQRESGDYNRLDVWALAYDQPSSRIFAIRRLVTGTESLRMLIRTSTRCYSHGVANIWHPYER
jgi:hypothetical protein